MKLQQPFKILNLKPESEILDFDYDTIDWSLFTERQKTFSQHVETVTFPFITSAFKLSDKTIHLNTNHPLYPVVIKEVSKLEEFYDAKARIAVLAGVLPNGKISAHRDMSELFQYAHRVHLPLVTDENSKFCIDDKEYHFSFGNWYEIDNTRIHSVSNNSNLIRVHLLVDLLPNKIIRNENKMLPLTIFGG